MAGGVFEGELGDARWILLGEHFGELGRKRVARLERHDPLKLAGGDVVMPLHQVLVAQHEVGRGRLGVGAAVRFQAAELGRVNVDARVKPDHRRPVPPGSGREHGIERRGRFVVPLEREQDECAEFVDPGIVGQFLQGLVAEAARLSVVAILERGAALVERSLRFLGGRLLRRRCRGVDGLGIVVGAACEVDVPEPPSANRAEAIVAPVPGPPSVNLAEAIVAPLL